MDNLKESNTIDFVVTWLDSSDPAWQKEFVKFKKETTESTESARFRNLDIFNYWFRAVEQFAPWVNKVFLVTNGTFPKWINRSHPKLVLVKHSDYIPEEFLPTFNSITIELFMHKIKGLSEHFVYFNDDFFLNSPTKPELFFCNGLPRDNNKETIFNVPIYTKTDRFETWLSLMCDIGVINAHFNVEVIDLPNGGIRVIGVSFGDSVEEFMRVLTCREHFIVGIFEEGFALGEVICD